MLSLYSFDTCVQNKEDLCLLDLEEEGGGCFGNCGNDFEDLLIRLCQIVVLLESAVFTFINCC